MLMQLSQQEHFRLTARPEQLAAAMEWLEYSGSKLGLDSQLQLRLQLVLEELFLNTLQHGHGQACDGEIDLDLEVEQGLAWLVYTDHAPCFDPRQTPPPSPSPEDAGVGLALIQQLPASLDYQPLTPGNRIRLGFTATPQAN